MGTGRLGFKRTYIAESPVREKVQREIEEGGLFVVDHGIPVAFYVRDAGILSVGNLQFALLEQHSQRPYHHLWCHGLQGELMHLSQAVMSIGNAGGQYAGVYGGDEGGKSIIGLLQFEGQLVFPGRRI